MTQSPDRRAQGQDAGLGMGGGGNWGGMTIVTQPLGRAESKGIMYGNKHCE